jgi:hypothetical protein
MPGLNKARGQSDKNLRVLFQILNTGGTPTIVGVDPLMAAGDFSIVDGGAGDYDVTIKNFRGPRGLVNIQATAETISMFASVTARSYSGNDLTFTVSVENDASSASDSSVDVCAEAY